MFGARAASYGFHYSLCSDEKMFSGSAASSICSPRWRQTERRGAGPGPKANCACVFVCVCQGGPYLHSAVVRLQTEDVHLLISLFVRGADITNDRENLFLKRGKQKGGTWKQTARWMDSTLSHVTLIHQTHLICFPQYPELQ